MAENKEKDHKSKSSDNNPSPVRNLFISGNNDSTEAEPEINDTIPQAEQKTSAKAVSAKATEPKEEKKQSRFRQFLNNFKNILESDVEVDFEDDPTDERYVDAAKPKKTAVAEEINKNEQKRSAERKTSESETKKTDKKKTEPVKTAASKEIDKNETKRTTDKKTSESETKKTDEKKTEPVKTAEKPKASNDKTQTKPDIKKTDDNTEWLEPKQGSESETKKQDIRNIPEYAPSRIPKEKAKKELPAYNIFDDNSKKTEAEKKPEKTSAKAEPQTDPAVKTETSEKPKETEQKNEEQVTLAEKDKKTDTSPVGEKKPDDKSVIHINKKSEDSFISEKKAADESNAPVAEVDDEDDITIIPWQSKAQSKNAKKDLYEGKTPKVTYSESNSVPVVVMAGKFTKTLRSEYEETRSYNKKQEEIKAAQKAEKAEEPKPERKKKASPSEVVYAGSIKETRMNSPELQRARFEPVDNPKKKQETPEKAAVNEKQTEKQNNNTKPERKIKKKTGKVKKLINAENDFDPEDAQEPVEEETQIDDYNEEKDAEAVKNDIGTSLRQIFVRSFVLFITMILSIVLAIVGQLTPLFSSTMAAGWLVYALISFLLFAVSVIISRMPIVNGLMPLRRFKGNSDTAIAIVSVATAIQSVVAIFTPQIFVDGTMHIYVPIAILALFTNSLGKLLIILRAYENFNFLIKPYPKFAGKIYTDINNAEKMVSEFPSRKTIIAYTRRADFMSNFLQLSYAPDPSEQLAAKIAPYAAVLSILCGIINGLLSLDFYTGVSSFALTACITTPIISLLAINIPMLRLSRNTLRSGAMVTSYETVKQFCDTNAVIIDYSQLYPKGTVTLSGMKAFKQSKINDAISCGAAVTYAVNGTMSGIFDNIVQCSRNSLPKVDNVIYEDNKGLVGWVQGQRILIGNRELLAAHNVKAPDKIVEERYTKDNHSIAYISVAGELIAMFILSYKPRRETIHELRTLEDNGVSFIIRTVDPNITKESVAEKFFLYHRCITILPTGLGNVAHKVMSETDDSSRAYLVTRGRLHSFAKAVSGCIRIKSNVTLSKILQYIAIVIGFVLVTVISFISGFEKLGCIEMLIYILFWAVATISVSMIKK